MLGGENDQQILRLQAFTVVKIYESNTKLVKL